MKDLKATRGAALIEAMVAEGEHQTQDFKYAITDARKIARSISAFANNCGGRLLIGVKDNGAVAGVRNEEDIYVVELAAHRYCEPPQHVDFKAYKAIGGLHVIVAEVGQAERKGVCVVEADGSRRAYFRVADENRVAPDVMVRAWQIALSGEAMTLTAVHYSLADILRGNGADIRDAALTLHISQADAHEAAAALVAAGVLTFKSVGKDLLLG